MTEWLALLNRHALAAGGGGLFALAVADSAGVPTGGGPDLVLILLASLRPQGLWAAGLAAVATVGSAIGCLALYGIGRRGRRWESGVAEIERARRSLERWGGWVVLAAMLAPPPIPTKLFVLAAGAAGVRLAPFLGATLAGRTLRYGAAAVLGMTFGPRVIDAILVAPSIAAAGAVTLLLLLAGLAAVVRWRWRRSVGD